MTPKAGWIAVLVATILAMALTGIIWKGCVDTATFKLQDAAAMETIAELTQENAMLIQSARAAASKATEATARANTAEQGQASVTARLVAAERNVARRPDPKTFEEALIANRDLHTENDLLKQALDLANAEARARKDANVLLGVALLDTQKALANETEINGIQERRVKGYQRQAKRDKRMGIVRDVVVGVAGLGIGIGVGAAI